MAKKRKAEDLKLKEVSKQPQPSEESEEESSSSEEEVNSSEESSSSGEEEEESSSNSSSSSEDDEMEDQLSKKERLRKLLEPFGKEQIIEIVKEAALKEPSILSLILQKADSDPTYRKIFVRGLSWDSTSEQVHQAFKPYGEIEECKLITDKVTGRAKGYAFVLFKTRAAARKALKNPQKEIGNRTTTCHLAAMGPLAPPAATGTCDRKLFVSNVSSNVSPEELRAFFGKFGEIEAGPMGLDPVSKKPRGFAIFVYKSENGLKKALEEPIKWLDGCQLNCKKFVEGSSSNNKNSNSNNQPQIDVNTYGFGMNSGIWGPNLSVGGLLVPQNPGIELIANPVLASTLNQMGLGASGLSPTMGGIAGNYGINSISPSVIGSYLQPAALQGLGAYQIAGLGQSSTGATAAGATAGTVPKKAQCGIGSAGMVFPPFSGC